MKLRKKFKTSVTGAMMCIAIASLVAHFADSNGSHFLVSSKTTRKYLRPLLKDNYLMFLPDLMISIKQVWVES